MTPQAMLAAARTNTLLADAIEDTFGPHAAEANRLGRRPQLLAGPVWDTLRAILRDPDRCTRIVPCLNPSCGQFLWQERRGRGRPRATCDAVCAAALVRAQRKKDMRHARGGLTFPPRFVALHFDDDGDALRLRIVTTRPPGGARPATV